MRLNARKDANQTEIAEALRRAGASVEFLHRLGGGIPDLLVGISGRNYILEVKACAPSKAESHLTPDQKRWFASWRGQKAIVTSAAGALKAVGL